MEKIRSVSVVIPAFNEEENVGLLVHRTIKALESTNADFEVILVDDGSKDNTFQVMKQISSENGEVTVVRHVKSRGKSMALFSGFAVAKGEAIVMIDADLQYDPEEIPRLLYYLEKDYDVVNGYRDFGRYDTGRTVLSRFYNVLSGKLFGSGGIHDLNCGLKAFRRDVVKQLLANSPWRRGIHRHLINYCNTFGYNVTEVQVTLNQRFRGHSKYGLKRILDEVAVLIVLFINVCILRSRLTAPPSVDEGN